MPLFKLLERFYGSLDSVFRGLGAANPLHAAA
jgi:hypothetical protein